MNDLIESAAVSLVKAKLKRAASFFQSHRLAILAHTFFGVAALYFSFFFFHIELSFAFVRNLGVAVTLWASLGTAFNFAVTHARTAESWFSGLNVTVLGASVLLCLVAMANHSNVLAHAIIVHVVLTLTAGWTLIARHYYQSRSLAWFKWFEELLEEDFKIWLIYLFAAYLPFYLPFFANAFLSNESHSETAATSPFSILAIEAASDGITAFVLFIEFFTFWWNVIKQKHVITENAAELLSDDEPLSADDVLARMLSTRTVRVGCLHWPPVVDCILEQSTAADDPPTYKPSGFYGKWLSKVAENNNLEIICVPMSWHNMKAQLRTGGIDILICAFRTESREKYADFSMPFHQCAMQGVARVGTKEWEIESAKAPNVKIVIAKNEVGFEYARTVFNYQPDGNDTRFTVVETNRIEEVASIVLEEKLLIGEGQSITWQSPMRSAFIESRRSIPKICVLSWINQP